MLVFQVHIGQIYLRVICVMCYKITCPPKPNDSLYNQFEPFRDEYRDPNPLRTPRGKLMSPWTSWLVKEDAPTLLGTLVLGTVNLAVMLHCLKSYSIHRKSLRFTSSVLSETLRQGLYRGHSLARNITNSHWGFLAKGLRHRWQPLM